MAERVFHRREVPIDLEYLEDEAELEKVLAHSAQFIGRIIIEFNALEASVEFCVKEILSHSETGDDLVYVFLAEMGYAAKANALVNLYGQLVEGFGASELEAIAFC